MRRTLVDYINELKFIRAFATGFSAVDGYNIRLAKGWSSARKRQITRYAELLHRATARPYYVFFPRRRDHLDVAKQAAGLSSLPKVIKVPLQVPTRYVVAGRRTIVKPKVVIRDGSLTLKFPDFNRHTLLFAEFGLTPEDVALDPEGALAVILEQTDYPYYTIIAGEFEVGRGVPNLHRRDRLIDRVLYLIDTYNAEEYDADDPSSSYFGNWLFGVNGYSFPTAKEAIDYIQAHQKYQTKRRKIIKKISNRRAYIKRLEDKLAQIKRNKKLSAKQRKQQIATKMRQIKAQKQAIYNLRYELLKP